MLDQVLKLFKITSFYDLDIMENNQTLSGLTARIIEKFYSIVRKEKPDWILVQGDTTTTFASALIGFYHKIRIGHIEAGLRTHNKYRPFPEEINRRLTGVLTDFHFAPTERTKENLIAESIPEENIFVTGNTVIDALFMTLERLKEDKCMLQHLNSQFSFLNSKSTKLILVTAHRRENHGEPLETICFALKEIVQANSEVKVIYPIHLNPHVQEPVKRILKDNERIHLINPLDYESFAWLMDKSYLILTDSGGIQEEAPSLGKPVLVLRQVTERPEAVEAGTVRVVGLDRDKIVQETQRLLDDQTLYEKMSKAANPYGDGKAAKRIVEVLRGVE
jgi:UDP-N-acetylglucosamine 2-epimerase (non-hydrolysing)